MPNGESTRFQQFEERYPVHAGGFHRDRVHIAGLSQSAKASRSSVKLANSRTGSSSRSAGAAT